MPAKKTWQEIKTEFWLWAFRNYYRKVFKNEHDPHVRFRKALEAASEPIRDRQKVIDWYERGRKAPPDDED